MNGIIINSVVSLGIVAACAAVILYLVSKKFRVEEDLRVSRVSDLLPGINCGNCGHPSCREFATTVIKGADQGDISELFCPIGGAETMQEVGDLLGLKVSETSSLIAVVHCNGSRENAPHKNEYDGPLMCSIIDALFDGENGCPFGCLRCGDCERSCNFAAVYMDEELGLPVVVDNNCVGCGACVRACPRDIIELRPKGRKNRRVWVACNNTERGGKPLQNCKVACIGCQKCGKECPEKVQAISYADFKAYIDPEKCITCRKCIPVCPTGAILDNFAPPAAGKKIEKNAENETTKEEKK